jgi:transposase-like protein
MAGFATMIDICQVKYLNNIIEQDHRFIKKINGDKTATIKWSSVSGATGYHLNYQATSSQK